MSWWSTAPVLIVTTAVMVIPGLLLALALGFRRLVAVAYAPLFSVGIAGVAAVIGPFIGIPWSIWLLTSATVVFSAVSFFLTRLRSADSANRYTGNRDGASVLTAAGLGLVIGGSIISLRTVVLIGNPENIAQLFDNVFHLNAVEWIVSRGDASSLHLGEMTGNSGAGAVYPAAWHSFGALVIQLTGTTVPIAVNAVNIVTAAIIWPLSAILLTRVVVGTKPLALVAAGVLSAAFIAFPYLIMVWGPLFPYMLSLALLPAALAAVLVAVGMGRDYAAPVLPSLLVILIAVAALAVSHMSTVNALLLVSAPPVVVAILRKGRVSSRFSTHLGRVAVTSLAVISTLGVLVLVWLNLRPVPYDVWGPHQTPGGAVGEVLTNSPMGFPLVSIAVSILSVLGIFELIRSRDQRWILLSFIFVSYLYVVDAGLERGPWRQFMTGVWYSDTNRIAALLPLFGVVLGAIGTTSLVNRLSAWSTSTLPRLTQASAVARRSWPLELLGCALIGILLVSVTQAKPLDVYLEGGERAYNRDTSTSVLSSDEYTLLERLSATLPNDAVIAGNNWNGSTLAFAFTGRETLSHHLFETLTPAELEVSDSLRDAPEDENACEAIRQTGVTHVLDFGTQYLMPGGGEGSAPGLQDLENSSAVRLTDEQGEAKLYEVVVCRD